MYHLLLLLIINPAWETRALYYSQLYFIRRPYVLQRLCRTSHCAITHGANGKKICLALPFACCLSSVRWSVNVYGPFCLLCYRCSGFSPHMLLANVLVEPMSVHLSDAHVFGSYHLLGYIFGASFGLMCLYYCLFELMVIIGQSYQASVATHRILLCR
jgi:hypothetical protein